jgi:TolB-like protein/DNA-binding winged helix-turn-helix (wHTH) protein/Tfp pilus assembly protein PilF
MINPDRKCYEFGSFVLDRGERLLCLGDARIDLPPRAFDTLLVLVENSGRLLEKDAIMRTVWRDAVVEENNLSQVIYLLRRALHDGENGTRYIETVPKRGYRFVALVSEREVRQEVAFPQDQPSLMPARHAHDINGRSEPHRGEAEASQSVASHAGPQDDRISTRNIISVPWWAQKSRILALVEVAVLLVVLLYLLGNLWRQRMAGDDQAPIRSLAVLPLQNLSSDPSQEYFADGMTDELITDLAQIHQLKVVSKTSVMRYKWTRDPLPQIGRDLGVDAVIEGSVVRSGEQVRITAQLIRTSTDHHIWAEAYDGNLKDILSLQARVAEAITDEVELNLTAEESGRLRRAHVVNPEAFDLYLRGRYNWNRRNTEAFQQAIEYYRQAIAKDPSFALAYAGLADSYTLLALYGASAGALTAARESAQKALQMDDSLAEAHTSLAAVKILNEWDWSGAEREFRRAIELNPNCAQAHHWYGNLLLGPEGRHDEAIAQLKRAGELDPLSPIITADTGFAYYLAGRYDLALQRYQQVLATNPNFLPVHFYLAKYYRQTGEYDLWLRELVADQILAGQPAAAQTLQQLYAEGGFNAVMRKMAQVDPASEKVKGTGSGQGLCATAEANAALGREASALTALEGCYRWENVALIYLKVDPAWANLRAQPRFQELEQRIRLQ